MWAGAQRDGRPAEYRWRPLQKFRSFIPCTAPQSLAGLPCSNADNIRERKTWMQSEFCLQKRICSVPAQETTKDCAKFGWPPLSDLTAVTKPRREIS